MKLSEKGLAACLVRFLEDHNRVATEVPYFEKRIDVVASPFDSNLVKCFEVKVSKWRNAFAQAVLDLPACHYAYVALHADYVHCVERALLQQWGIGLLSLNGRKDSVKEELQARRSPYTNARRIHRLLATLGGQQR
jgi:hypothetical protein